MEAFDGCRCNDGWEAWIDEMPPNRKVLHVNGSCTCQDGGHHLQLVKVTPQGINPDILLLRIEDRPDSIVPHHVQSYELEYAEEGAAYRQVSIHPCDITLDVRIVS